MNSVTAQTLRNIPSPLIVAKKIAAPPARLQTIEQKSTQLANTYSPVNFYKYFLIYAKGQKNILPEMRSLGYSLKAYFGLKLAVLKNEAGKVIGGYTYKIEQTKFDPQKLFFIDTIAIHKNNLDGAMSKSMLQGMYKIFQDIKKNALKAKINKLSIYVYVKDINLIKLYKKLGFKENGDHHKQATHLWYMTADINDFGKNLSRMTNISEHLNIKS